MDKKRKSFILWEILDLIKKWILKAEKCDKCLDLMLEKVTTVLATLRDRLIFFLILQKNPYLHKNKFIGQRFMTSKNSQSYCLGLQGLFQYFFFQVGELLLK
ncbi:hypothetical protein RF11_01238 [Thelohanellus kitauei]|uniref:Uncharacterized protein n=1 Tax=Thelohanellus kitauei TaxID=669202 RepID=A0A0C2N0U5_THEKT|nr:hypothetical protein RF11_01238 [Thelohanellus kitauei]